MPDIFYSLVFHWQTCSFITKNTNIAVSIELILVAPTCCCKYALATTIYPCLSKLQFPAVLENDSFFFFLKKLYICDPF